MTRVIQVGKLIDGREERDAIHIAVAPVFAAEELSPGQHVGLVEAGNTELAGPCKTPLGIVDPFLTSPVPRGARFWLFLYPNTITSLRHDWTHPVFARAEVESYARRHAHGQA